VLIFAERKVLLTGCWWLVRSERKYWWLVADKPSEQAVGSRALLRESQIIDRYHSDLNGKQLTNMQYIKLY
jgi:hypothetical protein